MELGDHDDLMCANAIGGVLGTRRRFDVDLLVFAIVDAARNVERCSL